MKFKTIRSLSVLLLAALLIFSLAACGKNDEEIPENTQYATAEGSPYRLFVPIDWNLMTGMGISGAYASAQEQSYATIFVRDYAAPDGLTPFQYAEQLRIAQLREVYPENELGAIAFNETKLDGKDACVLEYTGTREQVTYHTRELICINEGRVYILTCCAQIELFDGYATVFDAAVTNFRFNSTPFVPDKAVNTVDTDADAPSGMMLASNNDVAYRFYAPDTWLLDTALPTSSVYVSDQDRSNVNVTVYMPEVDRMTAEEYWALCEAEYANVMQNYTLISTTEGELDGRPSNTYVYTATVSGTTFRFAQTVAAYRGMVYTVTYTALDTVFDDHLAEYESMLAAFDFRGN